MKTLMVLCSAMMLVSCEKEWKIGNSAGTVLLPDAKVIPGGHCESSAMLNALAYQGYEVNESLIAGGGAALSFAFEKGSFPWLSARNGDMRELFFEASGIPWHKVVPADASFGWKEIYALLKEGTPVVLRLDMRYLPYRYNGRYGSANQSFGWHMITLFGIDAEKETALVSDTEYRSMQTIALKDLHKARSSDTKMYPPKGEFYWADKKKAGYALDWKVLVSSSLKNVVANYEWRDDGKNDKRIAGIAGMKEWGGVLADIESYSNKKFLLPYVFEFMAGNIEDFGTGGASFRILYRDFLVQAALHTSSAKLAAVIPLLDDAIVSWHGLSSEFREAGKTVGRLSESERKALYGKIQKTADELWEKENKFYNALKIVYTEG